jgi:hypothetical protein
MSDRQSGTWAATDNFGYDRVIGPCSELVRALGIRGG